MISHASLNHAFTLAGKNTFMRGRNIRAMTYGARLKEGMTLAKKVRRELAASLGISVQAIGQIINSPTSQLTAENSAKAARFLGIDHHWLATGEGDPRPRAAFSPMAIDLGKQFDAKVPLSLRDRVYSQIIGAIDLSATAHQQIASTPAAPPTVGHLPG